MFYEYNLPKDYSEWDNCKETYMVKITYQDQFQRKESFWVWIEKIEGEQITGIICNQLNTYNLSIGEKITFEKKHIKEITNRRYTIDQTLMSIEIAKSNPISKYFSILNQRFI
jgi:hypothetical protein